MLNSKFIIGKDSLSKLLGEETLITKKSVLVIYDIQADILGAKGKIKKVLPATLKSKFVKVKSNFFADMTEVKKCLDILYQCEVDIIIYVGNEVTQSIAKAVKVFASYNVQAVSDLQGDLNVVNDILSICIPVSSGDHQALVTGCFDIMDKKENGYYRIKNQIAIPDILLLDERLLDKMSRIAKLGLELGTLFMSLIAVTSQEDLEKKNLSITAIKNISANNCSLSDLICAEMYAGLDYLAVQDNLLDEFCASVKKICDCKYSLLLVLTLRKNIACFVDKFTSRDISLLGGIYNIHTTDETEWKEQLKAIIQDKITQYFEDKDIPNEINELGINSAEAEEIFDELVENFGASDKLMTLKDIVYSNL